MGGVCGGGGGAYRLIPNFLHLYLHTSAAWSIRLDSLNNPQEATERDSCLYNLIDQYSSGTHPSVEAVTMATLPSSLLLPAVDIAREKEKQPR